MNDTPQEESPRWQPLARIERRVVGVLVEKAKTTADNYPLSLNALVNGCNQKSSAAPSTKFNIVPNRSPYSTNSARSVECFFTNDTSIMRFFTPVGCCIS